MLIFNGLAVARRLRVPLVRYRSGGNTHQKNRAKTVNNTSPKQNTEVLADLPGFVTLNITQWSTRPVVRNRLALFGLAPKDTDALLKTFTHLAKSGQLAESHDLGWTRLHTSFPPGKQDQHVDACFTSAFFTWAAALPHNSPSLAGIGELTLQTIRVLRNATDFSHPAERFWDARQMRRKIIMHVGPTNSGKTHNALRALAAAKSGLYAGPLRLLAHEVFERLNTGQIVPAGIPFPPDMIGNKTGKEEYKRVCNLITGEEQKIIEEYAPLTSSTVEMVNYKCKYDVAVIDEIQLLGDPERGGSWTAALLGLCASEIHLCGEATAVPIVRSILAGTGETSSLVINKYERLTPLMVEEESLNGDLGQVRKGDCIVAFSRSGIFGIKKRVEERTGLKCAVAYGRLPPELRSEQADLFNDPDSGFDVMVGSDAIGMGLNLKIKRIIFDAVKKWDGGGERPLSISQIKQIAGRAGRYGLHKKNSATSSLLSPPDLPSDAPSSPEHLGGTTTTLHPDDLSYLARALEQPLPPLQHAYLNHDAELFTKVASVLPQGVSTKGVFEAFLYVGRFSAEGESTGVYRFSEYARLEDMCDWVDGVASHERGKSPQRQRDGLSQSERSLMLTAPVTYSDPQVLEFATRIIIAYKEDSFSPLLPALEGNGLEECLEEAEEWMASEVPPSLAGGETTATVTAPPAGAMMNTLQTLETFHKILVLYLWLTYRNPVIFGDREMAVERKKRLEKALEWVLARVGGRRGKGNQGSLRLVEGEGNFSPGPRNAIPSHPRETADRWGVYSNTGLTSRSWKAGLREKLRRITRERPHTAKEETCSTADLSPANGHNSQPNSISPQHTNKRQSGGHEGAPRRSTQRRGYSTAATTPESEQPSSPSVEPFEQCAQVEAVVPSSSLEPAQEKEGSSNEPTHMEVIAPSTNERPTEHNDCTEDLQDATDREYDEFDIGDPARRIKGSVSLSTTRCNNNRLKEIVEEYRAAGLVKKHPVKCALDIAEVDPRRFWETDQQGNGSQRAKLRELRERVEQEWLEMAEENPEEYGWLAEKLSGPLEEGGLSLRESRRRRRAVAAAQGLPDPMGHFKRSDIAKMKREAIQGEAFVKMQIKYGVQQEGEEHEKQEQVEQEPQVPRKIRRAMQFNKPLHADKKAKGKFGQVKKEQEPPSPPPPPPPRPRPPHLERPIEPENAPHWMVRGSRSSRR